MSTFGWILVVAGIVLAGFFWLVISVNREARTKEEAFAGAHNISPCATTKNEHCLP